MEDEITIKTLKLTAEAVRKETMDGRKLLRIPPRLYQAHPDAYTPLLVSIGPFHHLGRNLNRFKDVNILAMEGKKRSYMLHLLGRTSRPEETLQSCKDFLMENSDKIWSCYCEEIDISEELLVKIMLVDGCFLLWLLLLEIQHLREDLYPDPWILAFRRDIALLENQIPWFVLEGLLHVVVSHLGASSSTPPPPDHLNLNIHQAYQRITKNILYLFQLTPQIVQEENRRFEFTHLLDLITKFYHPAIPTIPVSGVSTHGIIPDSGKFRLTRGIQLKNATNLRAAGVKFQGKSSGKLLDLDFCDGKLRIPALVINDSTQTLLTNVLTYENLYPKSKEYFTSYVMFMNRLIQSKKDLQLLESRGIIINNLGSTEDASKMFSNICKQVVPKEFLFRGLCEEIEAYTNSRWQRSIQDLKRRYLKSPWTALSLFAATVLLILTMLQTIYTMLSYYQSNCPVPK